MTSANANLIALQVRKIAEYSAEREMIKAGLIDRWPQRSVYLAEQIENCQDAISSCLLSGMRVKR